MKTIIWAFVALIIAAGVLFEARYVLIINSPIVAKIDRVTGNVWIVNNGIWRKVEHSTDSMPTRIIPAAVVKVTK